MEIIFTHPFYLLALFSIPLLIFVHLITMRFVKIRAFEFANFMALARIAKAPRLSYNTFLLIIRVIGLVCMIFAVAGTTLIYTKLSSEFDFVIAIDSSSSMLTEDISPTRLDAAKESALGFLDSLSIGSYVGVVSFAGTSYVEQRLTNNFIEVREALKGISPIIIGGTDLGSAIVTSSNLLMSSEQAKAVVLLTDGRSNVGINPLDAIDYANENTITVYTIGIGTEEGGILRGTEIKLSLDEESLMEIAEKTSGKYFRARSAEELNQAYSDIANASERKVAVDLTVWLITIALIALILDWVLMNTKYRRLP